MKAVVTGGAGFIGSHLCDLLLSKGYNLTVIDNLSTGRLDNIKHIIDNLRFIEADLSKTTSLWTSELVGADYVFHLASLADIVPSIEKPQEYWDSNVNSTLNLLLECQNKNIKKFVYAASSSCYGIADQYPTSEDCSINPEYPYALTKRIGEELVLHWSRVYGVRSVSTRFFNVFGTRSRTSGTYGAVFGVFLAQKLAGKPLTIVGDGSQSRDFTYVTDVCEGMHLAATADIFGECINIASGNTHTINYLASLISQDVVYLPKRPGEPDITHGDISKARLLLGYDPKISFEEGVQLVLENIHLWNDAPVWDPASIALATKSWFDALKTC